MAVSAQTIINQAWIDLGVGSPGETIPPSEAMNALAKMNQMLDTWSGARDLVYEVAMAFYSLSNRQSFRIGPGVTSPPDFIAPRPIKIETITIWITLASGTILKYVVKMVPQKEWAAINDLSATGTVPQVMYFDPQVPVAVLNFWPIPLCVDATAVELGTWTVVGPFATLQATANLPPAYLRAITLGLELELVPTYGAIINPTIVQIRADQFKEAIAVVRSLNSMVQLENLTPVTPPPGQQPNGTLAQLAAALQGRGQ